MANKNELNAVVSHRIDVSPGLMIIRVTPDGWELPEFTPGQFAVAGLPGSAPRCHLSDPEDEGASNDPAKLIKRAYSISSSSKESEFIELYVTLVRSGALTPRLFNLKVGDRLWMSPKFTGVFTLDELPGGVNALLVSTGTGLAPYRSMLRTELECGEDERSYTVIHGARHSWDLGYRDELETMARLCPNFTYVPMVSRPADEPVEWKGEGGRVQELWSGGRLEAAVGFRPTPNDTHILLCGNPKMLEDMIELLTGLGFKEPTKDTPGSLHAEKFW